MPSGKNRLGAGLSRREALRFLGSASALPLVYPALSHHRYDAPAPRGWQPRFLAGEDVDTVACLSECVMPPTPAPGPRSNAVHEYIDDALYRAEPSVQAAFEDGLAWLKAYARRSAGRAFIDLGRGHQLRLLAEISDTSRAHEPKGYAFLTLIKQLTIEAYYSADAGVSV
jgi:hypothetical protein